MVEIDDHPERADELVQWLQEEPNQAVAANILRGTAKAFEGWLNATAPAGWSEASERWSAVDDPAFQRDLQSINLVFGDGRTLDQLRSLVEEKSTPVETRRRAIEVWAASKPPEIVAVLKPLMRDAALTSAVVSALVHCDDPAIAKVVLKRFSGDGPGQSIGGYRNARVKNRVVARTGRRHEAWARRTDASLGLARKQDLQFG